MIDWKGMWESRMLDLGMVLLMAVGVFRIAMIMPERAGSNDFAHYYVSSRLMLEGRALYGVPLAPEFEKYGFEYDDRISGAGNPPTLIWLFMPFSALPPAQAFTLWALLQSECLVAVLVITRQLLGNRISQRGWWMLNALAIISAPVFYHYYFSQVQLLLAAILCFALLLYHKGHRVTACGVVTLAGMLKLFPFVMLPWFLWTGTSTFRTRLYRLLASLLVVGAVLCITGLGPWKSFFAEGVPVISAAAVNQTMNFSLPAFVENIGSALYQFQAPEPTAVLFQNLGRACGAVLLAITYLVITIGSEDRNGQFSVLSVAMVIGGITAWMHYFVLLIFPMTVAAVHVIEHPSKVRVVCYGLILFIVVEDLSFPSSFPHLTFDNDLLKVLFHVIPLYAVLGLEAMLCYDLVKQERVRGTASCDSG